MNRRLKVVLSSLALLALAACSTVPETGRRTLNLMPESQMRSMSLQAFNDMKQSMPVSQDPQANAMAQRIGDRIASAIQEDYPGTEWEFVVFENEQINAFAMAGGKVGVFTGLIDLVDSDDELAAVIGHEIAHVTARHSNERMSQQLLAAGIGVGLYIGTGEMDQDKRNLLLAAYGAGSTVGVLLPYSRLHESEADRIGLEYLARAGYDPRAAVTFWEKMSARRQASMPEWLSTHPADQTRIAQLQALIPEMMPIYQANRPGGQ